MCARPGRPTLEVMNGLYSLKPWYAMRLRGAHRILASRGVSPHAVSAAGVVFGAGAGVALFVLPSGWIAVGVVGCLLAARLACANLDGTLARSTGRSSRAGSVINELSDRLAELLALAGAFALAPTAAVLAAMLLASAPSWIAMAGAAAGAPRIQGGPVGKTERAVILVGIALTGWATALLAVLAAGSALTAALRLRRVLRGTA